MNWEAISAISDAVGALVVLITLIYLALQVRQNTAAIATSTYESVMTGFTELNINVAGNPALSSILERSASDPNSLTPTELVQNNFLLRSYLNQWWKVYKLYKRGGLSEQEWSAFAREAAQALNRPINRSFRENNRLFAELYDELDRHELVQMSNFGVAEPPVEATKEEERS